MQASEMSLTIELQSNNKNNKNKKKENLQAKRG